MLSTMPDISSFSPSEKPAKQPKPPIPWWAWLFAAGCIAIPVITIGGAIPGALGAGGAAGCVGVARLPGRSVAFRIGICAAILAGCWALFGVLIVAAVLTLARRP